MFTDNIKIGIILVSLGLFFLALGIILFFDGGLLTIGNICLLSGFPFLLGFRNTLAFFNPFRRRDKLRALLLFFSGLTLVMVFRWAFIGIVLELAGMVLVFAGFLRNIVSTCRMLPVVGPLFDSRAVSWLVDKAEGASKRRPPV
jgi:hypothetical protein